MTTVIVQFTMPEGTTLSDAHSQFLTSAPAFQGVPGLLTKHYLYDMERNVGGGVYLWTDRAQAEAFHEGTLRPMLRDRYGVDPEIRYFQTPVALDNRIGHIEESL